MDWWVDGKKKSGTKAQYDSYIRSKNSRGATQNKNAYAAKKVRDDADLYRSSRGGGGSAADDKAPRAPGAYARAGTAAKITAPFDVGPGLLGTPGVSRANPATTAAAPAPEVVDNSDALRDLFDQLMAEMQTDVGAGPNLQDYIGGFGPARENALKYQGAATDQINAGTQALLAKLQQTQAMGQQDQQQVAAQADAATGQVQGDQAAAGLKAIADLQAQGINPAEVQAQQGQLGGQLQATATNQDAFAAKLAQLGATEQADRQASAQTMGQGAIGTLGLNTNAQLGQLNQGEAEARQQFGQDQGAHAARASAAKQNDVQTRLQLAQQFADLDNSTQVDPTEEVVRKYPQVSPIFDQLSSGALTIGEAQLDLETDIATEMKVPGAERDVRAIAQYKQALNALKEWEKATQPDAKLAAKHQQAASLAKYLQPR